MRKTFIAVLAAGSLSLGACATYNDDTLEGAGIGAGVGAVAGAGAGALIPGLSPIEGAVIGAAVGGVAGAVWADRNNDGYADGYIREGRYYEGAPAGYTAARDCPSVLGGAATGAAVGAAGGAGVSAITGGNILAGAAIGAAVGGIAGAVWADNDRDGCVDGYVREGRYYPGAPQPQPVYQAPVRSGERG